MTVWNWIIQNGLLRGVDSDELSEAVEKEQPSRTDGRTVAVQSSAERMTQWQPHFVDQLVQAWKNIEIS